MGLFNGPVSGSPQVFLHSLIGRVLAPECLQHAAQKKLSEPARALAGAMVKSLKWFGSERRVEGVCSQTATVTSETSAVVCSRGDGVSHHMW